MNFPPKDFQRLAFLLDELAEVELPEGSELLDEGEVGDADVDLLGDALVVREHGQHHRLGSLVEDLEAFGREVA